MSQVPGLGHVTFYLHSTLFHSWDLSLGHHTGNGESLPCGNGESGKEIKNVPQKKKSNPEKEGIVFEVRDFHIDRVMSKTRL